MIAATLLLSLASTIASDGPNLPAYGVNHLYWHLLARHLPTCAIRFIAIWEGNISLIMRLQPLLHHIRFKQLQGVVIEFETRVQVFVHSENFAPEPGKARHILA